MLRRAPQGAGRRVERSREKAERRRLPAPRARPVGHHAAGRVTCLCRRRVRRTPGRHVSRSSCREERAWPARARLLPQLREPSSTDELRADDRTRRLYPPAYADDTDADGDYAARSPARTDRASRAAALDAVESTIDASAGLDEAAAAVVAGVDQQPPAGAGHDPRRERGAGHRRAARGDARRGGLRPVRLPVEPARGAGGRPRPGVRRRRPSRRDPSRRSGHAPTVRRAPC